MFKLIVKDNTKATIRQSGIIIITSVYILALLLFTACKSRQDIILEYHERVSSIADEYVETMLGIINEEIRAIDSATTLDDLRLKVNWLREIKSFVQELKHDLRLLNPPDELQEFHNKALVSFDQAVIGINQLITVYESIINSPTTPISSEDLKVGFNTIGISMDIWQAAVLEMNKVLVIINESRHQS